MQRAAKECVLLFLKMAQQFMAFYYHQDESQSICYKDADLKVTLLFKTEVKAAEFNSSTVAL